MGISTRHLNKHEGDIRFDPEQLADALEKKYPDIRFCMLFGSAEDGVVKEGSDLDLAVYLNEPPQIEFYSTVGDTVSEVVPEVRLDLGFLNRAEPVFRYEALKGRLLFARNREEYAEFFSKTCREYESQLIDYERQHRYRTEADNAI